MDPMTKSLHNPRVYISLFLISAVLGVMVLGFVLMIDHPDDVPCPISGLKSFSCFVSNIQNFCIEFYSGIVNGISQAPPSASVLYVILALPVLLLGFLGFIFDPGGLNNVPVSGGKRFFVVENTGCFRRKIRCWLVTLEKRDPSHFNLGGA